MKLEQHIYISPETSIRTARFGIVLPNRDESYAVNICTVYQFASIVDFTMQAPSLGWSSWQHQTSPELVRLVADAFQQGADLLELWAKDTGKPSKEVLNND